MTVARSRTFRSGNSEAVRLPKDVAYGDDVELEGGVHRGPAMRAW